MGAASLRKPETRTNSPHPMPPFIYGTAWKEEATQRLTELAIRTGFRGIDTANQRRHYDEAAVGAAVATAIDRGWVTRKDLFLQTKFTFQRGQDHRLPYDPNAPIATQVEQSFASSLRHLGVDHVDSYLLHGPTHTVGLSHEDWAAWRAMEAIFDGGQTKKIGVSNVSLEQLQHLDENARVRPSVVQNRCFAVQGWDDDVRQYCTAHGIGYQGFSLLTANRQTLASPVVAQIAARHRRTIPQIIFRFAIEVGITPLTGTTSADHMQADLKVLEFRLDHEDVERIDHPKGPPRRH